MASTDNTTDSWTWAAMEPEPTEQERALYDTFCAEFLVDRSPIKAASRCGFQASFAADYGKILFQKSYVQRRLAAMEAIKPDTRKEREYDAVNTKARLRAIINDDLQKASARVAAARELNAMHGFHAPTKIDVNSANKGGVMVLPVGSAADWEAAAKASQQALMDASRVD